MPSKYPLSLFFFLSLLLCKGYDFLWFQPGMDNLKWVFVASVISLKFSERKQYSDSRADSSSSCEQGKTTCRHTLVPLVVLEIALGAAAPVAPDDVLAAVLAAMVPLHSSTHLKRRQRCLSHISGISQRYFLKQHLSAYERERQF